MKNYEKTILSHYKGQAETMGKSECSTTPDVTVRKMEIEAIINYLDFFLEKKIIPSNAKILDIGCGNGNTLEVISKKYADFHLVGVDYTSEMVNIAKERLLPNVEFYQGDVRALSFSDETFDLVISERCVINVMDWNDQKVAITQINRVLNKGGMTLFIEGFDDALINLNDARKEFGLDPIPTPHHNLFFKKSLLLPFLDGKFEVISPKYFQNETLADFNFMSSHYFTSRVVHPMLVKLMGTPDHRNSHFVKFFAEALKPVGNYSFVQLLVLKK